MINNGQHGSHLKIFPSPIDHRHPQARHCEVEVLRLHSMGCGVGGRVVSSRHLGSLAWNIDKVRQLISICFHLSSK